MSANKFYDKLMHFLVHNSLFFTVIVMGLVHVAMLIFMLCFRVYPLVQFNILSVVVYSFCLLLAKTGYMMPVYISIMLEVFAYSLLATLYVGWDSGSHHFLFSIVPIIVYFGASLFKGAKRWIVVILLVLDFLTFATIRLIYSEATPMYQLNSVSLQMLNIFINFVMIFSVCFYNYMYIYSSEEMMVNLQKQNKQLSVDAKEDELTNLLNRRGFLPILDSLMHEEPKHHFCIAFCDVDNFKRINDSYGHDCGDEVLRHITKVIKKEMHGCDICRWGGEEFIILMRDYDMNVAIQKMEYLRKTIETNDTVFYNKHISATMTIGVEEYSDTYHDPEDVIKTADERMYYGKQHGKNIVIASTEEEETHEEETVSE